MSFLDWIRTKTDNYPVDKLKGRRVIKIYRGQYGNKVRRSRIFMKFYEGGKEYSPTYDRALRLIHDKVYGLPFVPKSTSDEVLIRGHSDEMLQRGDLVMTHRGNFIRTPDGNLVPITTDMIGQIIRRTRNPGPR